MSVVPLSPLDLAMAAGFTLLAGILSMAFGLRLERTLAISTARLVVQLALVGIVLKFVFEQASPWWTMGVATVMVLAAGLEAVRRQRFGRMQRALFGLGTLTLFLVGLVTTLFTVAVVVSPKPWYAPQYLLPVLGMILGNSLTALGLVVASLSETARRDRAAIEARLALGETRHTALGGPVRTALAMGMTPVINAMAVAGLVSLPGMMTGQIMAGTDPIEAAKYQIMIMLVLAGASAFAAAGGAIIGVLLLTDSRHRLRLDRLK